MTNSAHTIKTSENLIYHRARAKFIPLRDGSMKLVQVQQFSEPRFRRSGWEASDSERKALEIAQIDVDSDEQRDAPALDPANVLRATRRAKIRAFDTILCNPDLDTFATFTYAPDDDLDKASYESCYEILRPWLSNRVQRKGLRYVIVPELHKSGAVHFHGIMNSAALKLIQAYSPYTGKPLTRNKLPIYNLVDWRSGFSTAQIIGGEDIDREKVAKYIFKYMGKQLGARIGGRYALIGGANLIKPAYAYGDSIEEFLGGDALPTYRRDIQIGENLEYSEVSFM